MGCGTSTPATPAKSPAVEPGAAIGRATELSAESAAESATLRGERELSAEAALWLQNAGLSQYWPALFAAGHVELTDVLGLTFDQLTALGVKPGHARKLLKKGAHTARVEAEGASFEMSVAAYLDKYRACAPFTYTDNWEENIATLNQLDTELAALEAKAKALGEVRERWHRWPHLRGLAVAEHRDIRATMEIKFLRLELTNLKSCWDLVSAVHLKIAECHRMPWAQCTCSGGEPVWQLEEEFKALQKKARSLDRKVRKWDVFKALHITLIRNTLVALPLVGDLAHPSMRDRHWKLLMSKVGTTFTMDESFLLGDLLALGLHSFGDDVEAVLDISQKEEAVERKLRGFREAKATQNVSAATLMNAEVERLRGLRRAAETAPIVPAAEDQRRNPLTVVVDDGTMLELSAECWQQSPLLAEMVGETASTAGTVPLAGVSPEALPLVVEAMEHMAAVQPLRPTDAKTACARARMRRTRQNGSSPFSTEAEEAHWAAQWVADKEELFKAGLYAGRLGLTGEEPTRGDRVERLVDSHEQVVQQMSDEYEGMLQAACIAIVEQGMEQRNNDHQREERERLVQDFRYRTKRQVEKAADLKIQRLQEDFIAALLAPARPELPELFVLVLNAADFLALTPLVTALCQALATRLVSETPDQIRATLGLAPVTGSDTAEAQRLIAKHSWIDPHNLLPRAAAIGVDDTGSGRALAAAQRLAFAEALDAELGAGSQLPYELLLLVGERFMPAAHSAKELRQLLALPETATDAECAAAEAAAREYACTRRDDALWYAARDGDDAEARRLLAGGRPINARLKNGETALHRAVEEGHAEMVHLLLEAGAETENIRVPDDDQDDWLKGATPLAAAATLGLHVEVVRPLVAAGANLEAANECDETALHHAAEKGNAEVAKLLVQAGARVEAKRRDGTTALMLAARNGHPTVVKILLEAGADIMAKNADGLTCLLTHWWSRRDPKKGQYAAVVKLLIDAGATVEGTECKGGGHGFTPLMWAAATGPAEVVQALLDAGANIEAKDNKTKDMPNGPLLYTALIAAAQEGRVEAMKVLLEAGANVEAKRENGATALIAAAHRGHERAVCALVDAGASLECKLTNNGMSALMVAAQAGRAKACAALLEAGADIQTKSPDGRTVLMAAADHPTHRPRTDAKVVPAEVVKLLISAGASLEATQTDGTTALMIAADRGNAQAVHALLDAGASVEAKRTDGTTALMLAVNKGHAEVVKRLLEAGADTLAQRNDGCNALQVAQQAQRSSSVVPGLLQEAAKAARLAMVAAGLPSSSAMILPLPSSSEEDESSCEEECMCEPGGTCSGGCGGELGPAASAAAA